MRIQDEKHLVRVANEALMRFFPADTVQQNESEGHKLIEFIMSHTDGVDLTREFLSAMSNGKLGQIIGMRGETYEYKKYSLLQTIPREARMKVGEYQSGHTLLVEQALPVIIASMCDILHTKRIIKEKDSLRWQNTAERSQTRVWNTWPKREMMIFIREHCAEARSTKAQSLQTA